VTRLGRKQPDGAKIAALRNQSGLKQADLATKAGLSERVLREVERRNHRIPATTLTAIATALQTTPDEITLATDGRPESSISLLKLRAIRSGKDLTALASGAAFWEWHLEENPTPATAKDIQNLLMIVTRLVNSEKTDEFDTEPFGEIPRLARLQELLEQLRKQGVGVIAGKYGRYWLVRTEEELPFDLTPIPGKSDWSIKTTFVLCLRLVAAEKEEGDMQIRPGKSLERWLEDAQHLSEDDIKRLYIPF
jgi:transcriptional regulator with XRE-family HTH domain